MVKVTRPLLTPIQTGVVAETEDGAVLRVYETVSAHGTVNAVEPSW